MNIVKNIYLLSVVIVTFVLPALLVVAEYFYTKSCSMTVLQTWFLFSAVGLRLLLAGLRQLLQPQFTLHKIFGIYDAKCNILVQELGLHNIIIGALTIGIVLFFPYYTIVIGILAGSYFGAAGLLHMTKRQKSVNQYIAMISDAVIAIAVLLFSIAS